jgi:hypothetical protein
MIDSIISAAITAPVTEIVALDRDGSALNCRVKSCSGDGFATLMRWLGEGDADALLLSNNGCGGPLVLVNWDTWNRVAPTVIRDASWRGNSPPTCEPQQSAYSVLANAR